MHIGARFNKRTRYPQCELRVPVQGDDGPTKAIPVIRVMRRPTDPSTIRIEIVWLRWGRSQPCICTTIISPLTIHGQPNLSVTMPKPLAQNVGPNGMVTLPPSAIALNTRSACATAS
jgi:hypothetical protein